MTQAAGLNVLRFKARNDKVIGGTFVAPVMARCFNKVTSLTGTKGCETARSDAADIHLAGDAVHAARDAWGRTSAAHL